MKTIQALRLSLAVATAGILVGCSDSGDSPTGPGKPSISVSDPAVNEGASAAFVVSLSAASSGRVIFDYATANGTAASSSDYTATTGRDTIEAGALSVTVSVPTADDAATETAESFSLTATLVTGDVTVGKGTGTCTIAASDGIVTVSFSTDVAPILSSRCAIAGCHGSGSVSGGMTLGGASWSEVRNASGSHGPIIIVGNSGSSNLYLKTTSSPPFGVQMPAVGAKLTIAEQQKIRDWIDQGALNN